MPKLYATCDPANVDETTGTCSQVVWVEDASGWLPELSHEDGAELGMASFGLLFVAFAFRLLRKRPG